MTDNIFIAAITNNLDFLFAIYLTNILLFLGVIVIKKLKFSLLLKPIDYGKNFVDGKRIIGDHKPIAGWLMPLIAALMTAAVFKNFLIFLVICYSAFFGDLAGSFSKKRFLGMKHKVLWGVDQLSFLIGGFIAAYIVGIHFSLTEIFIITFITFFLHIGVNIIGFMLGLKSHRF